MAHVAETELAGLLGERAPDADDAAGLVARDEVGIAQRVVEEIRLVDVDDHRIGSDPRQEGARLRHVDGGGIGEVRGVREVEAGAAGRTMARLFRVAAADPVLIARRVVYGSDGRPVEWTLGTYRGDRYRATYRTAGLTPPGTPG